MGKPSSDCQVDSEKSLKRYQRHKKRVRVDTESHTATATCTTTVVSTTTTTCTSSSSSTVFQTENMVDMACVSDTLGDNNISDALEEGNEKCIETENSGCDLAEKFTEMQVQNAVLRDQLEIARNQALSFNKECQRIAKENSELKEMAKSQTFRATNR